MVTSLIELSPRDYMAEPLPAPADDRIRAFVASEVAAGKRTELTRESEWLLIGFASRMASLAVRESSAEHVKDGLAALSLVGKKVGRRDGIIFFICTL